MAGTGIQILQVWALARESHAALAAVDEALFGLVGLRILYIA